jgi:hypothetical protein
MFKQIHRSTIVNMKAIAAITRDETGAARFASRIGRRRSGEPHVHAALQEHVAPRGLVPAQVQLPALLDDEEPVARARHDAIAFERDRLGPALVVRAAPSPASE